VLWLTALALLAGSLAADLSAQSTVTDRQSGVPFRVTLTPPGGGAPQQLTGTATREKTIFRIKVYAYGLYVDAGAARTALAAFSGRPAAALDRDGAFFQRLLDMRVPMTLRLVMTRDVAGDVLGRTFDDALKPRVTAAAAASKGAGGAQALQRFRAYFNLREVSRGMEIMFSCGAGGVLNTTVNGESRPPIQSQALCWALFDVYLGDKPVSLDGRRNLISGFPALLAASR
jgi:hypothetical protein